MNEQRNNGRGIFYGVIGVATLVVAIIGATFAYFTATASNNVITGNMATVSLNLAVEKVTTADVDRGGMIPMSNGMVEKAVNKGYSVTNNNGTPDNADDDTTTKQPCIDDNGNAVCQIYKITLTNSSSAGQFVDGYVALRGGSGAAPTDLPTVDETTYEYVAGAKVGISAGAVAEGVPAEGTTMRWAQVFETTETNDFLYTTAGTQALGSGTGESVTLTTLDNTGTGDAAAKNLVNIRTKNVLIAEDKTNALNSGAEFDAANGVLAPVTIAGTVYNAIGTNYIRLSNHAWKTDATPEAYDRTADITSALVFNHSIAAGQSATYYVVVWLSETGTNQTANATVAEGITNPGAANFFLGNVTFVSAQGSEVSATFSGYARVESDQA